MGPSTLHVYLPTDFSGRFELCVYTTDDSGGFHAPYITCDASLGGSSIHPSYLLTNYHLLRYIKCN